ncbi:MAG: hypothetical protein ABSH52_18255 [Terriglobia bacterium]|jgi:hypothetical protein
MTKSQLRERREYHEALLKWFEKMSECYAQLGEQEKLSLDTWDAMRSEGQRTCDWAGWEKYIGKVPSPP